jgi:exodeoxyribonuclease VII large subunit
MPFNDEGLARAIAASTLPVVTGIGHEPDNSIADMVADFRASTPTAAAEHIVPSIADFSAGLAHSGTALARSLRARLEQAEAACARLRERPLFTDPLQLFRTQELQLEGAARRLDQALPLRLERDQHSIRSYRARLSLLGSNLLAPFTSALGLGAARLESLSPLAVLSRGYAIASDREGHVIDAVDAVDLHKQILVRLVDGALECTVDGKRPMAVTAKGGHGADDGSATGGAEVNAGLATGRPGIEGNTEGQHV